MTSRSPETHWGLTYEQLDESLRETLRTAYPATHARLFDCWRRRGKPTHPKPYRRIEPYGFTYIDPGNRDNHVVNPAVRRTR